ncbi:replication/maintenance protein RepL [Rhizobium sp.]|uniref:replication/maintenance protein RepL n=1 Tax=Rhizobium sp. TaxID=391 RepID=UPI003F8041EA
MASLGMRGEYHFGIASQYRYGINIDMSKRNYTNREENQGLAGKTDNSDNFYIERAKWTDYVHARRDFTHGEFRVAYFIVSKINADDECMWYSVKRIAAETPASLATVENTISKLDNSRLISIGKKKIGRQTVDTYAFRMPLDAEDQAFKAVKPERKKTGGRKPRVSKNETLRVSKNETKSNKA